jgi:hypothetical protein
VAEPWPKHKFANSSTDASETSLRIVSPELATACLVSSSADATTDPSSRRA